MIIKAYSKFVSKNPLKMFVIVLVISILAFNLSSLVGTKSMDNKDTLPDSIDVISAFNKIEDNFGGSDSIMIAVDLDNRYANSNEIRDLREPEAIKYLYLLAELSIHVDDVISTSSPGTILKDLNNGVLPNSKRQIIEYVDSGILDNSISKEFDLAIVSIRLSDSYDENIIVEDLQEIISQVPRPPGLRARVAGDVATGPVMQETIGPDMARTSNFSLIGILVVLLLVFFSFRYALTPLMVIGVGILWAFGFFGLVGIDMSPVTSGAISMIMGIGIDFGIQTIMRFRYELKSKEIEEAMEETISSVFKPMFTTTLAALIGFQAMSMGDLTVLKELGTVMSYGVLFCFLSAITVVPILSIYGEKFFGGKKK